MNIDGPAASKPPKATTRIICDQTSATITAGLGCYVVNIFWERKTHRALFKVDQSPHVSFDNAHKKALARAETYAGQFNPPKPKEQVESVWIPSSMRG